jgi:hypothetical protein
MSGKIDVLAVLDDAIPVYGSRFTHDDFDATRAAVAELIGFVQDCADGRPEAEPSECRKRAIDLLASIGGSK